MSCDHAVWFPRQRLSDAEAGRLYEALWKGDTSGVQPHPAIDAFYADLVAKYPEDASDDDIDNEDINPWSMPFYRSPAHLIMCCVWPKAEDVRRLLRSLARKHGLALYDPVAERVYYPDSADEPRPWWKFW
jgi:hypothetical protein